MSLHIVLVEPEIPQNTGNIARSCVATDTVLHLVKPLGFDISDRQLKRAGLDYWKYLKKEVHENLDDFMDKYGTRNFYLATTKGKNNYANIEYKDEDMLIFGKETAGLPLEFREKYEDRCVRIPLSENVRDRSLNLSNSANIILFEALRQLQFPNLK